MPGCREGTQHPTAEENQTERPGPSSLGSQAAKAGQGRAGQSRAGQGRAAKARQKTHPKP